MLKCYLRHRMADKEIDGVQGIVDITGLSRNTVNKLYRSKNLETIKIETLIQVCDALNCKLSELIEYIPE